MTHVGMECLVLALRPEGVFRVPDGEASRRAGSGKSDTANRERTLDAPPATGWAAWDAWSDARIKQALDERQRFLFDVLAETLGRMAADERKTAKRELADELRQLKIELAELAPVGPFSVAGRPRTGGGQQ
jgi:hypothetical protein